jgi:hypothetical protein
MNEVGIMVGQRNICALENRIRCNAKAVKMRCILKFIILARGATQA